MVPQYTGQLSQDIRRRFSGDKLHGSDCNFREPSAPISARGGRCTRQVPPSLDEPPKEGPAPLKVTQGSHGPRVSRCRSTPHGCEFSALPHSWERETGGSWATPRPSGGGGSSTSGYLVVPRLTRRAGGQPSLRTDAGPPSASRLGTRATEGQDPRPLGPGALRGHRSVKALGPAPSSVPPLSS